MAGETERLKVSLQSVKERQMTSELVLEVACLKTMT